MLRSELLGIIILLSTLATGCGEKPKEDLAGQLAAAEATVRRAPAHDAFLDLSKRYFEAQNYPACITAAGEAIRLKPNSALAYNNQAACFGSLRKWDEEILAAQQAVRISPGFQLAKNNLAWAEAQKNAGF